MGGNILCILNATAMVLVKDRVLDGIRVRNLSHGSSHHGRGSPVIFR
jgi:hypothetical protein